MGRLCNNNRSTSYIGLKFIVSALTKILNLAETLCCILTLFYIFSCIMCSFTGVVLFRDKYLVILCFRLPPKCKLQTLTAGYKP